MNLSNMKAVPVVESLAELMAQLEPEDETLMRTGDSRYFVYLLNQSRFVGIASAEFDGHDPPYYTVVLAEALIPVAWRPWQVSFVSVRVTRFTPGTWNREWAEVGDHLVLYPNNEDERYHYTGRVIRAEEWERIGNLRVDLT